MRCLTTSVFAAVAVAVMFFAATPCAPAADVPADRVVAMYFHRTERCPTCQKMGSYSEEAVKTGFAQQIKDGTVAFYYVDFQNPRNAALTRGYRISAPTLIVAKIASNKVEEFKNLEDIWSKVGQKQDFLRYVQDNVTAFSKRSATVNLP